MGSRTRKQVNYRKLAGLSLETLEDSDEKLNDCILCAISTTNFVHIHNTLLSDGYSAFHNLEKLLDFSFQKCDEGVLCDKCFQLLVTVVDLREEFEKAKHKLQSIVCEEKSTLNFEITERQESPNKASLNLVPSCNKTKQLVSKLSLQSTELSFFDEYDTKITGDEVKSLGPFKCDMKNEGEFILDREKNNAMEKEFICAICGGTFAILNQILDHLASKCCKESHSDQTLVESVPKLKKSQFKGKKSAKMLFTCEYENCNKTFTRKASMLEHSARHKGIREKECTVSNRANCNNDRPVYLKFRFPNCRSVRNGFIVVPTGDIW